LNNLQPFHLSDREKKIHQLEKKIKRSSTHVLVSAKAYSSWLELPTGL
jgi:hypothetical protein